MDLQFYSFSILIPFLVFIFMVYKVLRRPVSAPKLPPGPWKLPIIGNMHQLGGPLPHRTLRDLSRKYGPVMHLKMGEVSTIVFSSQETAKEVLKTYDVTFASRPPILASTIISYDCTSITFAPYGEYWRQLRKICILELLSTKRVLSYRSVREDEMLNLVKWIASKEGTLVSKRKEQKLCRGNHCPESEILARSWYNRMIPFLPERRRRKKLMSFLTTPINLTEKIYSSQYGMTSRAAFGGKCKEQDKFIGVVKEAIKFAGGFGIADLFPSVKLLHFLSGMKLKIEKLHQESDRMLEDIINDHKEAKLTKTGDDDEEEEDLVDVLLKFQKNGDLEFSLTTDNIKAVIPDIFSAGSETPATSADWIMAELVNNPRIMGKATKEVREVFDKRGKADESGVTELKYLKSVVKEGLRLHPPVPLLLPRECAQECEIHGYKIPLKTKGIVNAWALGRDPDYWTNPEKFDPERFDDSSIDYKGNYLEYIPFGAGRRICPGMTFGLAQVELQIAMLLYHFDWELPNGMKNEDMDMSEYFAVTVKRKHDLYLIPKVYRSSFIA